MRVIIDPGAYSPVRAHDTDAGLDLRCKEMVKIWPGSSAVIDTGVHVELPHGYYGKIESKSGLNVNSGVVSLGGVIDEGYTGRIVVKLYNFGRQAHVFYPGDKVAQLIVQPCAYVGIELVDSLPETDRGSSGFGSTGA